MSQGNNGSLSTIHARSAADVFAKLATYAAQYEKLDFAVAHSLIANAVDFVVFIEKNPTAGRPPVRDRGPGGRRRPGRPGGQRADLRPVPGGRPGGPRPTSSGSTFERNKALHAAGYDDTAHSFVFGGR